MAVLSLLYLWPLYHSVCTPTPNTQMKYTPYVFLTCQAIKPSRSCRACSPTNMDSLGVTLAITQRFKTETYKKQISKLLAVPIKTDPIFSQSLFLPKTLECSETPCFWFVPFKVAKVGADPKWSLVLPTSKTNRPYMWSLWSSPITHPGRLTYYTRVVIL